MGQEVWFLLTIRVNRRTCRLITRTPLWRLGMYEEHSIGLTRRIRRRLYLAWRLGTSFTRIGSHWHILLTLVLVQVYPLLIVRDGRIPNRRKSWVSVSRSSTLGLRLTEGYLADWQTGGFIACDWFYSTYQVFWKEANDVRLPPNVCESTDFEWLE